MRALCAEGDILPPSNLYFCASRIEVREPIVSIFLRLWGLWVQGDSWDPGSRIARRLFVLGSWNARRLLVLGSWNARRLLIQGSKNARRLLVLGVMGCEKIVGPRVMECEEIVGPRVK